MNGFADSIALMIIASERVRRTVTNQDDLTYIRAEFRAIASPREDLPAPSYYDVRGTAFVPRDYETQEASREGFASRAKLEIERLGAAFDDAWIADAWDAYWSGTYGMCLKEATPENIVRKNWLIDQIGGLIEAPRSGPSWLGELRNAVDGLDELEKAFCTFDRAFFGGRVSRDTYIDTVRRSFPELTAS
jgi:hypothetical protein